jgi:hypothetical protein
LYDPSYDLSLITYSILSNIKESASILSKRQISDQKDREIYGHFEGILRPLIFNSLPGLRMRYTAVGEKGDPHIIYSFTMRNEGFFRGLRPSFKGLKVIHTLKNLFCYVVLICNLVQEFNGLVSKGPAI